MEILESWSSSRGPAQMCCTAFGESEDHRAIATQRRIVALAVAEGREEIVSKP